MSGTTRGRGALAATVLFAAGCVRVPASIREDFAPLRPGEPSNFDPGPKGVAPAHEAVGYEPTSAPAPSPAPPSSVEPVPEVVAPPVPSATNAAPAAGAAS